MGNYEIVCNTREEAGKLIKEHPFMPLEITVKEKTNIAELIPELMKNKFNGNMLITFEFGKITICSFSKLCRL